MQRKLGEAVVRIVKLNEQLKEAESEYMIIREWLNSNK